MSLIDSWLETRSSTVLFYVQGVRVPAVDGKTVVIVFGDLGQVDLVLAVELLVNGLLIFDFDENMCGMG